MREFVLDDDDHIAIGLAIKTARRLLRDPRSTPGQVIGLGHTLYALERLPLVTPGFEAIFGINYREAFHGYREMRCVEFCISESAFEISRCGSVSGPAGSDTISEPGWSIELNGFRSACELDDLDELIENYLALGAEIFVTVESCLELE